MIVFILKYCAILASFILFYKLFLENESFHILKRFYLLLSPVIAALIPLISFPEYVETSSALVASVSETINITQKEPESNFNLIILWIIYCIGFTIMGIRFITNIYVIAKRIRLNPKHKHRSIINVLLKEPIIPYTFLNFIFLNKHKFDAQLIPEEVLLHEEAHVVQKHSLDILFVELLQIVFWFNPLVYIINKSIKLNHEFLADQAVINHGVNSNTYLETLLAFSSNAVHPKLANAINYSSIKKRFTIMKTQTSKFTSLIKGLVLLPLLGLLLYSFSDRTIVELGPNNNNVISFEQKKATPEQVAEYNKLAKHYNSMFKRSEDFKIHLKDVKHLKYLYSLMSDEQRKSAEPFPQFPEPPAAPEIVEVPVPVDAPEIVEVPAPIKAAKPKVAPVPEIVEVPAPVKAQRPKAATAPEIMEVSPSAPPAAPKSPLEHVKEMAKKGAEFKFNGKSISSSEAIKLLKSDHSLNIITNHSNDSDYVVNISSEPIEVKPE